MIGRPKRAARHPSHRKTHSGLRRGEFFLWIGAVICSVAQGMPFSTARAPAGAPGGTNGLPAQLSGAFGAICRIAGEKPVFTAASLMSLRCGQASAALITAEGICCLLSEDFFPSDRLAGRPDRPSAAPSPRSAGAGAPQRPGLQGCLSSDIISQSGGSAGTRQG